MTEPSEPGLATETRSARQGASVRATGVVSGAMWITIDMLALQIAPLVSFAVLAHFLTARDFGLVSLSFVFIYSLKSLTIDMIMTPVTRKKAATSREYSTGFWLCSLVGVFGVAALVAVSVFIDDVLRSPGLGRVLRPMSLVFLFFSVGRAQDVWLMRHTMFRTLAVRSITGVLLGVVTAVGLAVMHFGVWSLVFQQLVASGVSFWLLWLTAPWRPRFEFSGTTAREIGRFSRQIFGNSVLGTLNQNADLALVGIFFGPSTVGIYSVAKRLRLALQMAASNPVTSIAGPMFANVQDDPRRLSRVFVNATRVVFAVCAPIFLGAAGVALPTVTAIFGARWSASAGLFAWLAIGALAAIGCDYLNMLIVLRDRQVLLARFTLLQIALGFGLFVPFSHLGPEWAAAPFVLPYVAVLPLTLVVATRLADVSIGVWLGAVAPPVTAALLMLFGVSLVGQRVRDWPSLAQTAALGLFGALLYLGMMLLVARPMVSEAVGLVRDRFGRKVQSS